MIEDGIVQHCKNQSSLFLFFFFCSFLNKRCDLFIYIYIYMYIYIYVYIYIYNVTSFFCSFFGFHNLLLLSASSQSHCSVSGSDTICNSSSPLHIWMSTDSVVTDSVV